jgi:hypothetical protein
MTDQELQQVAERYRAEGYDVRVKPNPEELPPFATDFDVDILATSPNGSVLVRAEETREALRHDDQLSRAAKVTNSQPGWQFDVVILRPDTSGLKGSRAAKEPSPEYISQLLDNATVLMEKGYLQAAYPVAWGALEAALRRATCEQKIEFPSADPVVLLRTAYSSGLITFEEFQRLEEARKVRSSLVHGFELPSVDVSLFTDVVKVARRMLTGEGAPVGGQIA